MFFVVVSFNEHNSTSFLFNNSLFSSKVFRILFCINIIFYINDLTFQSFSYIYRDSSTYKRGIPEAMRGPFLTDFGRNFFLTDLE